MGLSSINTFATLSAKMNIKSYKKIDWIYDMNLIAKWKKEKQLVDQNQFETIEKRIINEYKDNSAACLAAHFRKKSKLESTKLAFNLILASVIGLFIQFAIVVGTKFESMDADTMLVIGGLFLTGLLVLFIISAFMIHSHRENKEAWEIEQYVLEKQKFEK